MQIFEILKMILYLYTDWPTYRTIKMHLDHKYKEEQVQSITFITGRGFEGKRVTEGGPLEFVGGRILAPHLGGR